MNQGVRVDGELELAHALKAGRANPDNFVWIGLSEPDGPEFAAVAEGFDLHPLAVEDAIHAHQRPSEPASVTSTTTSSE